MRKHFKQMTAILLTAAMMVLMTPQTVLAEKEMIDVDTQTYTSEEIQALADGIDVPEGAEVGVFSFAAQVYAMRRNETEFSFSVLRGGSCEEVAEVALTVADISATYGIDYVLEINGNTLEAQEGAMQFVATKDKHDSASIFLTEEYLSDMGKLEENSGLETETESQQENREIAQSTDETDITEQSVTKNEADSSRQEMSEQVNTEKTPLQAMKEELFGKEA